MTLTQILAEMTPKPIMKFDHLVDCGLITKKYINAREYMRKV